MTERSEAWPSQLCGVEKFCDKRQQVLRSAARRGALSIEEHKCWQRGNTDVAEKPRGLLPKSNTRLGVLLFGNTMKQFSVFSFQ